MDDTTRYRIAKISDGFPHFVHLVCEKLFWEVFEDTAIVNQVRPLHFIRAIEAAVLDIEQHLRTAYETATKKYTDYYEEVLWAVADDKQLSRRSIDIFASYERIMKLMKLQNGRDALTREKFNQRMNLLKKPTHARILKANRAGWYEFTENIMRGYVRLRAAGKGVDLEVDHPLLNSRFKSDIDIRRQTGS